MLRHITLAAPFSFFFLPPLCVASFVQAGGFIRSPRRCQVRPYYSCIVHREHLALQYRFKTENGRLLGTTDIRHGRVRLVCSCSQGYSRSRTDIALASFFFFPFSVVTTTKYAALGAYSSLIQLLYLFVRCTAAVVISRYTVACSVRASPAPCRMRWP